MLQLTRSKSTDEITKEIVAESFFKKLAIPFSMVPFNTSKPNLFLPFGMSVDFSKDLGISPIILL